jgi:hypothetical protein
MNDIKKSAVGLGVGPKENLEKEGHGKYLDLFGMKK